MAGVLAMLGAAGPAGPAVDGPVVIYLIDTLRADRVSVYGGPADTTPAAAALAAEGVAFDHAYALSTWTRPSVATLLTSRLPAETATLNRFGRLSPSIPYVPEAFQKRGYRTAAFNGNGNVFDARLGFQHGFDVFVPIEGGKPWKALAREVVDPAIRFIEAQSSPRFFLFVHVVDPHEPYMLDEYYTGFARPGKKPAANALEQRQDDYERAIRAADDQFARLAAALRARGWWNGATVIYTADHGEQLGDHGDFGHGRTLFDEEIRIPLILKFPGNASAGTRRADPVSLADVAPTLARLGCIPADSGWIGRSLTEPAAGRDIYLTEDLDDVRLYGLVRGGRKYVVQLYPKFERKVFDLGRDPHEQAGRSISCADASGGEDAAARADLEVLREREARVFPSLTLEKTARTEGFLRIEANVADVSKPFLTASNFCEFVGDLKDGRLLAKRPLSNDTPLDLFLSADDHGKLPAWRILWETPRGITRLTAAGATRPVQMGKREVEFMRGPSTDALRNLRALGYLGGKVN